MGGLINSIFGGGSNKQANKSLELQNKMHADTMQLLKPYADQGGQMFRDYSAFLSGGPEQQQAFDNWLGSSDYNFMVDQGQDALTSSAAAKGLLKSGAFGRSIVDFGQQMGNRYRQQYTDNLFQGAGLGASAAGAAAGANQNNAALQTQTRQNRAEQNKGGFENFLNFGLGVLGL